MAASISVNWPSHSNHWSGTLSLVESGQITNLTGNGSPDLFLVISRPLSGKVKPKLLPVGYKLMEEGEVMKC